MSNKPKFAVGDKVWETIESPFTSYVTRVEGEITEIDINEEVISYKVRWDYYQWLDEDSI